MRQVLEAHLEPGVEAPYPHYSIRLVSEVQGPTRRALHLLYKGDCLLARSKDPLHVLEALLRHLSEHDPSAHDATTVRCVVLAGESGNAVLLGPDLRRYVAREASQLATGGLGIVPTPLVVLDGALRQVRLPAVPLKLAFDPLADFSGASVPELQQRLASERLFSLKAWVFTTLSGRFVPVSRSVGVAAATNDVLGGRMRRRDALRDLVPMVQAAVPLAAGDLPPWEIIRSLADVTSRS